MLKLVVKDSTLRLLNRSKTFAAISALLLLSCGTNPLLERGAPYGMADRVQWTTSRIAGSPDPAPPYELRRVFPQFTFDHPVFVAQDPMSDRLLVAEYEGRIYSFIGRDPVGKKSLFLDMKRRISAFSFHPQYHDNGQVFVFSPTDPTLDDKEDKEGKKVEQMSRVSRFESEPGSDPPRLRPESETIIIEWPAGGTQTIHPKDLDTYILMEEPR